MMHCPSCHFIFVTPLIRDEQQKYFIDIEPSSQETVATLAKKYPRENYHKKDLYSTTAKKLLTLVSKNPTQIHAVDLGASGAFFVHELIQRDVPTEHTLTVEMSPNYIELTRRYFGYPTERGNVETITLAPNTFDICTMFDVLEHVSDVPKTLQNIHRGLVENGLLFLKLPNGTWARWKSLVARLLKKDSVVASQLYIEPGGHLNYWNTRNVRALEQFGFNLAETGYVQPTRRQFRKKFPLYALWYWITKITRLPLYPEFYAIFRKR